MTTVFVDGPDGVGKTGYSEYLADAIGAARLEMRPVNDIEDVEKKARVFNAAVRDLNAQGVKLVIDRGSVSSIVYSRIFGRPRPDHAWATIEEVEPFILYLRCDAEELKVRYEDEIFGSDRVAKIARTYDDVMAEIDEETNAVVSVIDTTTGAIGAVDDAIFDYLHNDGGNR